MALAVRSKVKDLIKNARFSGDFFEALDKVIEHKVRRAAERSKGNGRSTLRPVDL